MFTELGVFAFLYWRFGRSHAPGKIMGLYLVLSSVARFSIEFTRFHEQGLHFGLSLTQWISIGLAVVGAMFLVRPSVPAKVNPPVPA
jgi:prolipoprotein diacylglyceryltransferase